MLRFVQDNWLMLLPLVLGFAAVYLLLPQARRSWTLPASALGALAVVLAGLFLARWEFLLVEGLLFYAFAGIAIVAAGSMVTQSNPVHAALSFALVLLASCGLFLLLGAPFLMAATIVVYAGAIVVTFLFVIMLAQQQGLSSADRRSREPFLSTVAGLILVVALVGVLQRNYRTSDLDGVLVQVEQVAGAKDLDETKRILGDPRQKAVGDISLELVDRLDKLFVPEQLKVLALEDAAGEDASQRQRDAEQVLQKYLDLPVALENAWQMEDFGTMKGSADQILKLGYRLRYRIGSLSPRQDLPLSPWSGRPNDPLAIDAKGRAQERLPAANVTAIGRALYTDYLVAVELAGMLLLVATIGAIAIAGRRSEELR